MSTSLGRSVDDIVVQHDVHGVFCVVTIAGVEVKLRCLPKGQFVMGSSASEIGRTVDEGPQHTVQIAREMWMFDTQVTQSLWVAVMGHNPSHFRSFSRPVECVSFCDVQSFISKVNDSQSSFFLKLPTEAQWEYACRAGTQSATWAGNHHLNGCNNAPVLDDICWYAGNASMAFRSENGVDSSNWFECDHHGVKAGTHAVGLKSANPWGLFDMLGNVWEWCRDGMREYSDEATELVDPIGVEGLVRCARGGSWRDSPRKLRASYRDQIELNYKNDFVGFRCLLEF